MMEVVKVTSNGTVSIPASFRRQFNTEYYQAFEEADRIIFVPIVLPKNPPKARRQKRWTIEDLDNLVYHGPENSETISKSDDEVLAMYYDEKMKRSDPSILDHLFKK